MALTPLNSPARTGNSPEGSTQMRASDSELENCPVSRLCGQILIEPCAELAPGLEVTPEPGPEAPGAHQGGGGDNCTGCRSTPCPVVAQVTVATLLFTDGSP